MNSDLLLFPSIVSALNSGAAAYTMDMLSDIHFSKPMIGTPVVCHVCGASRATLYKDGDEYICSVCKKEREKEVQERDSNQ